MKIAITGCIACGKTTFSKLLSSKMKIKLISADKIVEDLYTKKELINKLSKLFNEKILDSNNNIDKKKLRQLIFNNKSAKNKLENFIHPLVEEKIKEELKRNKDIIAEMPLLFEANLEKYFDTIITLYTDKKTILTRLKERSLSTEVANKIIEAQLNIEEKIKKSHYTIQSTGSILDLEKKTKELIKEIKKDLHKKWRP